MGPVMYEDRKGGESENGAWEPSPQALWLAHCDAKRKGYPANTEGRVYQQLVISIQA